MCFVIIGLTKSGRAPWQEEEDTRKDFSIVLILQEQFCTLELSKVIQDAILLILHYRTITLFWTVSSSSFCHVGCAINLHTIINSGLIPGGQHLSSRQTVFFLHVDPMNKEHKDPNVIDLGAPRLAQHMQKVMYLLRHSQHVNREDDGAIEFWRITENLQKYFLHCPHWSDSKWKVCLAGGGGNKKIFQYCTDSSGTNVYLRGLQGHSGRNLIDPSLQDNVIIQSDFFQYIFHVGCAINLHSIICSGLVPGGQSLSNRQTAFFLPVDPMDKEHKDPDVIDLNEPRHAQYMHKAWKKHQNTVCWVDIKLAQ